MEDCNADETGKMPADDKARCGEEVQGLPIFNIKTDDPVGRSDATSTGEDVGGIEFTGKLGDTLVAIVGGFLRLTARAARNASAHSGRKPRCC